MESGVEVKIKFSLGSLQCLYSYIHSDNVKKALVQQGYAEHLAKIVSSAESVTDDESWREKMQSASDMIVMLLTEGQ